MEADISLFSLSRPLLTRPISRNKRASPEKEAQWKPYVSLCLVEGAKTGKGKRGEREGASFTLSVILPLFKAPNLIWDSFPLAGTSSTSSVTLLFSSGKAAIESGARWNLPLPSYGFLSGEPMQISSAPARRIKAPSATATPVTVPVTLTVLVASGRYSEDASRTVATPLSPKM